MAAAYPPPGVPAPPNPWQAPAQSGKAVASLVLGILSVMCCMGLLTGAPAVVLGFMARKDVARSEGTLDGGGLATAGIVTGGIGTLGSLAYLAVYVVAIFMTSAAPGPSPYVPPAMPAPPPTYLRGTGKLHVLELRPADGALKAQLAKQAADATARGERVLVMTLSSSCAACSEIAHTFGDFEMQVSLSKVTVVKVDVTAFAGDLAAAGLERGKNLPWFFLLGAAGGVVDSISADEWDDNRPENIAPVLDEFLAGTLTKKGAPPPAPL